MRMTPRVTAVACVALAIGLNPPQVAGQGRAGAAAPPPPEPMEAAPIDITGYWVSIVNEDYRWRMVTPPKGDYASVPLSDEGKKVADTWDVSKDGRCDAYGAAAVMRMPTRLHITWEGNNVVKIETDAGQQTRRLLFGKPVRPPVERTLQGFSAAEWVRPPGPPGGGAGGAASGGRGQPTGPAPGGSLKVVTTQLRPGWLRRNGVPYSEDTTVTEYIDRFTSTNGDEWLVVTTLVNDPKYLTQEFVTSSHFKKEGDGAKWSPSPCRAS